MMRNLKALGLAMLAAFALSAAAAADAQAVEGTFSWEEGTTKLVGEADPTAPTQLFSVTPGIHTASFKCDEVTGTATVTGTGAASVTAKNIVYSDTGTTPETNKCTGTADGFAAVATVRFNKCDYHFVAGTTEAEAPNGKTEGTVEIKCEKAGEKIEVEEAGCTVTVAPQTVGPVYYYTTHTTGHPEEVTVEAKVGKTATLHNNAIDYVTSGLTCGSHTETDGTYEGKVTIKGFNASNAQTNVTVT
jgi:hypothetical protein